MSTWNIDDSSYCVNTSISEFVILLLIIIYLIKFLIYINKNSILSMIFVQIHSILQNKLKLKPKFM